MNAHRSRRLYLQVLIGIGLGVLIGVRWPAFGAALKPLATGFIALIKMTIGPVIFCTVVAGIAGMGDLKKVGRVGLKAVLYFEVLTTAALLIGLLVGHLLSPGAGMQVNPATLSAAAVAKVTSGKELHTVDFLLHIIPDTLLSAFTGGDLLQVLLVAVLFGFGVAQLGEKGRPVFVAVDQVSRVLFRIIHIIVTLAPLGALGAMAFTVGTYGLGTLGSLARLLATFYATCLIFVLLVLGLVLRLCGLRIVRLIRYIKDELLIVLGTSSSESVLPQLMEKLEVAGCSRSVVGLVVPAGYSFNLDGTCIYLTLAVLFIAQALHVPLSLRDELTLLAVLLVSSKGAAGVTGSGFLVLAATLSAVPTLPVAGLTLILGVDRFMSEARALTNLVGNATATLALARWEGELDAVKAAEAGLVAEVAPAKAA